MRFSTTWWSSSWLDCDDDDYNRQLLIPSDAIPALAICSSSCDCTPETPTAPTHSAPTMIGTPPWIGRTGMLRSAFLPALTRSSQFLVVRRDTAALRPFSIATCALNGVAPSRRTSHSMWPPSSRMAIVTFHLFLRASASAAAPIFLQSSRVRQGLLFTLSSERFGFVPAPPRPR